MTLLVGTVRWDSEELARPQGVSAWSVSSHRGGQCTGIIAFVVQASFWLASVWSTRVRTSVTVPKSSSAVDRRYVRCLVVETTCYTDA